MALPIKARLATANELRAAVGACRHALIAIAVASGFINILMLTGSLFMLQVYDRVLPSHSIPTLVGLLIIVVVLYAAQGVLDMIRARIMVRIGRSLDEGLSGSVFQIVARLPLQGRGG